MSRGIIKSMIVVEQISIANQPSIGDRLDSGILNLLLNGPGYSHASVNDKRTFAEMSWITFDLRHKLEQILRFKEALASGQEILFSLLPVI